ncbi:MAG: peptidoglycan-binding protein, partial [Desulfobacula sp.]|nr:peptidoglycan-binding protein [Desulfobacula sp.]
TISKRMLKTSATTREVIIPAVTKTIKKRIMVSAPVTKEIVIPAEYGKVKVTRMVSPATSKKIIKPAVYDTVQRRVMTNSGHLEWTQILCQTNMTQVKISRIQQALVKAGYDPGPIDGVIGTDTMKAVNKFQSAKKLAVTKYLTFETLQALNVRM